MASVPPPSQIPVRIGEVVLGKYVVERVIGSGSMGSLVAVRHQQLGELYAMKFLLPHLMLAEGGVARFLQEASIAAKLRSEHAVKVHDVGQLPNGAVYMLMEYVAGEDLAAVLARRGPLPPRDVALYVTQACDAIGEAHSLGIVHRDLKPANVLLTTRPNGTSCVKVLDFGISKSQRPDGHANAMTRTSAVMGSPHYMSPEQIRSAKYVGSSTDIWSLGVVMHELLSGTTPFSGATLGDLCGAILTEPPVALPPHVPPGFVRIVIRCLEKRPEQRFASVAELARALSDASGASESRPLVATMVDRTSVVPSLMIESRPSPKLAATQVDAVSPVRPKRGNGLWLLVAVVGAVLASVGVAYWLGLFRPSKTAPTPERRASADASVAPPPATSSSVPTAAPPTSATASAPPRLGPSSAPPAGPRTSRPSRRHGID